MSCGSIDAFGCAGCDGAEEPDTYVIRRARQNVQSVRVACVGQPIGWHGGGTFRSAEAVSLGQVSASDPRAVPRTC
eukprot:3030443-Pleurochrysis_carterae.AAC.1